MAHTRDFLNLKMPYELKLHSHYRFLNGDVLEKNVLLLFHYGAMQQEFMRKIQLNSKTAYSKIQTDASGFKNVSESDAYLAKMFWQSFGYKYDSYTRLEF